MDEKESDNEAARRFAGRVVKLESQLDAANKEINRLLLDGREACNAWNEELTKAKEEIARLTEWPNDETPNETAFLVKQVDRLTDKLTTKNLEIQAWEQGAAGLTLNLGLEREYVEKLREFVTNTTQCKCLSFSNGTCYRCITLAVTKK